MIAEFKSGDGGAMILTVIGLPRMMPLSEKLDPLIFVEDPEQPNVPALITPPPVTEVALKPQLLQILLKQLVLPGLVLRQMVIGVMLPIGRAVLLAMHQTFRPLPFKMEQRRPLVQQRAIPMSIALLARI